MATIFFAEDAIEVIVAAGTMLKDAIDEHGAAIPFGCREGACATCVIRIHEGAEHLSPLTENEEMTLLPQELEDGVRLACQCSVSGGRVSIQAADP
jgi:ferredoxin